MLTAVTLLSAAAAYLIVNAIATSMIRYADQLLHSFKWYVSLLCKVAPIAGTDAAADALVQKYRKLTIQNAVFASLALILTVGSVFYSIQRFVYDTRVPLAELAAASLGAFVFLMLFWNQALRVWLALTALFLMFVVIPGALFNVNIYDNVLRRLGYGGGLPITVTVTGDPSETKCLTAINAYLMLRTNSALILYEPEQGRIREVPLQQILYIDQRAVPLPDRKPKLP